MTRPTALLSVALLACLGLAPARADDSRGHWSVAYQQIRVDSIQLNNGEFELQADTQSLNFDVSYRLGERTTVHVGIPLVRKRFVGSPSSHRPDLLDPPQDAEWIDDGRYRTNFQDWRIGVSYLALRGDEWWVEPFAYWGLPSHDYPHFGNAAAGQNLWHVELGSRFTYHPLFSDVYYRVATSWTFVEKTLGVSVNHARLHAEVGYHLRDGVVGRAFVQVKKGEGLEFPDDFPPGAPDAGIKFYQHDRLVKHNYSNWGVGVDWALSNRTIITFSTFQTFQADQVHVVKYAFQVGISRAF